MTSPLWDTKVENLLLILLYHWCHKVQFLGLWYEIRLFGANWSEKGPVLHSKSNFEGLRQHQIVLSTVLLPNDGTAECNK